MSRILADFCRDLAQALCNDDLDDLLRDLRAAGGDGGVSGGGWWTMRDGRRVRIRDMSNKHLWNTIRFVRRSMSAAETTGTMLDNDTESDVAFRAAEAMDHKLCQLVAEARRRGLAWPEGDA